MTTVEPNLISVCEDNESQVRSYCRSWPTLFDRARGSWIYDAHGRAYLDFFAGAGALNYGHNNPALKQPLLRYLTDDHIVHAMDTFTEAKGEFLAVFRDLVLAPRGMEYRVQFPGPGGANAVEAALKLARKVTGRSDFICFDAGFHGMSLGGLAVSGGAGHRAAADGRARLGQRLGFDAAEQDIHRQLATLELELGSVQRAGALPAAAIVETVQGDGGINVARDEWLRALAAWCAKHEVLLIIDDIQMGCGRTGPFFSFERAGVDPDIVCLSKSISGYGLPLALTLLRPEHDVWEPGEHTGTFRAHSPALVTGAAALRSYWADDTLQGSTLAKGRRVAEVLSALCREQTGSPVRWRGRGLAFGLEFADPQRARAVGRAAFERELLVETCGPRDAVVKLLPPLTITDTELDTGLMRLLDAVMLTA